MKKQLLAILVLASTATYAQKTAALKAGQEITITTKVNQEINMMMPMTNATTTTNKVVIAGVDAKNYTVVNTLTRMSIDGDMMGQKLQYDSDKKEDRESENGQAFGAALNKPDTVLIDIKTGEAKAKSPEKAAGSEADNALQGMMSGALNGDPSIVASSILFVVPGELKTGFSWKDSSTANGMKTVTNYKVTSVDNTTATIATTGTVNGSTSMEMQGQSLEMEMKTKTSGTVLVDVKTGAVKKRNNVADIDGSMDMMGQKMPFTSKTTIETNYN